MKRLRLSLIQLAVLSAISTKVMAQSFDSQENSLNVLDTTVVQAASEELKQAPGVSIMTAKDFEKIAISNDISEIVRTMPGVNLTGNSNSGQRGNNRQIDLRGMGPENTLILIDGKPVLSRNSVRMGRAGERDTRGDSNWVPVEAIERIEVIRGPAAARYGSGASGGVVNIITKQPTKNTLNASVYYELPENDLEGVTYRGNILASGPISEKWSHRTLINYNKTDADSPDLNRDFTDSNSFNNQQGALQVAAGQEGVKNQDIRSMLRYDQNDSNAWELELAYSRQGNIYAGDNASQGVDYEESAQYIGEETNIMRRTTFALTHKGNYEFGDSVSYIQYEKTKNERLGEGLVGNQEGSIITDEFNTIELDNLIAKTEWNIHSQLGGLNQTFTLGAEYRSEKLNDPVSLLAPFGWDGERGNDVDEGETCVPGGRETCESDDNGREDPVDFDTLLPGTDTDPEARDPKSKSELVGIYVEDNILLTQSVTLTPGVRADYHTDAGFNLSPSINIAWQASNELVLRTGVSRAFKAPNLYQLNPNYVYYNTGRSCPTGYTNTGNGCNIIGNSDLEHETSLNKEVGLAYNSDNGFAAGITYFHNDYKNRIATALEPEVVINDSAIFRWVNVPEAVVSGLEGNLTVPFSQDIVWTTNATVMLESENKENGDPLSLVPEYTVNSSISWTINDDWDVSASATAYGKTESPSYDAFTGVELDNPLDRDAYALFNLVSSYQVTTSTRFSFSVKNLFDEQVYREGVGTQAGANTYNEPGRSFAIGVNTAF